MVPTGANMAGITENIMGVNMAAIMQDNMALITAHTTALITEPITAVTVLTGVIMAAIIITKVIITMGIIIILLVHIRSDRGGIQCCQEVTRHTMTTKEVPEQ